uniref:factor independent urate hydroxylase n=1 Tax=Chromera velia CCMP2878 TaxID=1169474 RepID=A0A0G4H486_9ALVE|eukprot:Cvel_5682.t1-p1 / transcript=Cvel_5682.t1 / gene=Cvel_5682 / organism=Chromera_velia_CCMP2878 / gene_product=Hemerythrin-like protein, putative / transcript_product=Hemerythrin-like protein, putative / location=Cvel_scaffold268:90117-91631(+) / protein_length=505 / sequence_SO=supercontig / SO=protein_coding / is_pseudo=false
MPSFMISNSYGHADVRLHLALRPTSENTDQAGRSPDYSHWYRSLRVHVELKGDFAASYVAGNNTLLIPTDTIKNITQHVVFSSHAPTQTDGAQQKEEQRRRRPSLEVLGNEVGSVLLRRYSHVSVAKVRLEETPYAHASSSCSTAWSAVAPESSDTKGVESAALSSCFLPSPGHGTFFAEVVLNRGGTTNVTSGVMGLQLVRTARGAAFSKFLKDSDGFTTLDEKEDVGVMSVEVDLEWDFFSNPLLDLKNGSCEGDLEGQVTLPLRQAAVLTFSTHASRSLQHTCLAIGKAVVGASEEVKEARVLLRKRPLLGGPRGVGQSEGGKEELICGLPGPGGRAEVRCAVRRTHVEIPSPFVWNAEMFDCKEDTINEQHAALFDLIRELDDIRSAAQSKRLLPLIVEHALQHFEDEEKIFEEHGYAEKKADMHAQIHKKFAESAQKAAAPFLKGEGKAVEDQLVLFLKKWLVEHVCGPDMQFARFLEKKQKAAGSGGEQRREKGQRSRL